MVRIIDTRISIEVHNNKQIMMGVGRRLPFCKGPAVHPITLDEARRTVEALNSVIDVVEKNRK